MKYSSIVLKNKNEEIVRLKSELEYQTHLAEIRHEDGIEFCAQLKTRDEQLVICNGTFKGKLDGKDMLGDIFDGTDAACPGWWRGYDHGFEHGMKKFSKQLDHALICNHGGTVSVKPTSPDYSYSSRYIPCFQCAEIKNSRTKEEKG